MKSNAIVLILLTTLSVLTSFVLIFFGMNTIMAGTAPEPIRIFAYLTTAYGLANIAILSVAWSSRMAAAAWVSALIAFSYLGVFVVERFKGGTPPLAELAAIALLAVALGLNWLAVRLAAARE
jgi:hypothetical protein